MRALLQAQRAGDPPPNPEMLSLDAAQLPEPWDAAYRDGHAAWLEWPWKLHVIRKRDGETVELYDLEGDPDETRDRSGEEADRVRAMRASLDAWRAGVVQSYNGNDYD